MATVQPSMGQGPPREGSGGTREPLAQTLHKWQQRVNFYTSQGVPASKIQGLMSQDIVNVQSGKQPMTPAQVYDAITTAQSGQSTSGGGQSEGLNANPIHDLGVAWNDITRIPENFVGGLKNVITHFPSEVTNTGDVLQNMIGLKSDEAMRQEAAQKGLPTDPAGLLTSDKTLLGYIPGVSLIGSLETPQGREDLGHHPVSAALQLAPYVGTVGKLAAGSDVAGSDIAAAAKARVADYAQKGVKTPQKVTKGDRARALQQNIEAKQRLLGPSGGGTTLRGKVLRSSRQALQQGNPYAAGAIAGSNVVRAFTHRDIRAGIAGLMEKMGFDRNAREYAFRAHHDMNSEAGRKANIFFHDDVNGIGKYTKDERAMVRLTALMDDRVINPETKEVTRLSTGEPIDPIDVEALNRMDEYNNLVQEHSFEKGYTGKLAVPGEQGKFNFYPMTSDVMKAFRAKVDAGENRIEAARKLREENTKAKEEGRKIGEEIAKLRRFEHNNPLFGQDTAHKARFQAVQDRIKAVKAQHDQLMKSVGQADEKYQRAVSEYNQQMQYAVPMSMHPLMQEHFRNLVQSRVQDANKMGALNEILAAGTLDTVLAKLKKSPTMVTLQQYIKPEVWNQMLKESANQWMKWNKEGYAPVLAFNHALPDHWENVAKPQVWRERSKTPKAWQNKNFDETPGMINVAVGLSEIAKDEYARQGTTAFFDQFLLEPKHGITSDLGKIKDDYYQAYGVQNATDAARVDKIINQHYNFFDPRRYGVDHHPGEQRQDNALMIRSNVKSALDSTVKGKQWGEGLPFFGKYDKALNIWRYSVLTGPRHWVHVGLGGLMMATLRGPDTILYLAKTAKYLNAMRKGEPLPEHLQVLNLPIYMVPDRGIFNYSAALSMGRAYKVWRERAGAAARAPAHFEEMVGSWLRIATYMRAGAKGLDHDAAIREALRTYIDMGNMHPVERNIIRTVFPFYSFTKHILRYVMEYPVDHPFRAAMLANIANMEIQDWNSQLPQKFAQMLFWGPPDANGNATATDIKNINPFRSLGNDFSLAGFISGANPAIAASLQGIGINVLSGTPELYPQLAFDVNTGSLIGQNPDSPTQMAEQLIPEFGVIDHYLQLSSNMRAMAQKNPGAYQRQLLSSLNIPFETSQVNPALETEKMELNKFRLAQNAVGAARKSGDWSGTKQFKMVPFNGKMYDPNYLEAVYNQALAGVNVPAGVSPEAVSAKRKGAIL